MKFSIKRLLAMTALLAAVTVHAQSTELPPGAATGTLAFSGDAEMALSGTGVRPRAIEGVVGENSASYADLVLGLNFSSLVTTGNDVTSLLAPNSWLSLERREFDEETGDVLRYSVFLADFEFDLAQSIVRAELFSLGADGEPTSLGHMAIFTASEIGLVGGTQGHVLQSGVDADGAPQYIASGSLAGNLNMNTEATDLILDNLNLGPGVGGNENEAVRNFWLGANWGAVSFTAAVVPELSTYAMFGLGLIGLGLVTRRRSQAA